MHRIFFWQFRDYNDFVREWSLFVFNILVFFFTLSAFLRTYRHYGKFVFELLPLSVNMIAAFILLMLKLFERGYIFDEIGHFIEIFTYFLFCYTFAIMHAKFRYPHSQNVKKAWNIILLILFMLLIAACTLVFAKKISRQCNEEDKEWPPIATLVFEFLTFMPTIYYGVRVLREIRRNQKISETPQEVGNSSTQTMNTFTLDRYYVQRVKQVKIVLIAYFTSLVLRLFVSLSMLIFLDYLFECESIEGITIITSDYASGQVVLIGSEFVQLLPHIVIPIAMYVIPLRRMSRRNKSFYLDHKLIGKQDDSDDDKLDFEQDAADSRISSLLNSRLSDDSTLKSPLRPTKERS